MRIKGGWNCYFYALCNKMLRESQVGSDTKTLAEQGLNQQGLTYESELGESTQGLTPPPRHKTVAKVKPLKVKFFDRILTRKESGLLHRFLNAFLHRLRKRAFHYTPSHWKICCQAFHYIPLHSIAFHYRPSHWKVVLLLGRLMLGKVWSLEMIAHSS